MAMVFRSQSIKLCVFDCDEVQGHVPQSLWNLLVIEAMMTDTEDAAEKQQWYL